MSIQNYVRQIEKYIDEQEGKGKSLDSARGLLAPRSMRMEPKGNKQANPMDTVKEFIYALRKKRKELKSKRAK
jgi:hypothetical protein